VEVLHEIRRCLILDDLSRDESETYRQTLGQTCLERTIEETGWLRTNGCRFGEGEGIARLR
jgi:hypothetical protein